MQRLRHRQPTPDGGISAIGVCGGAAADARPAHGGGGGGGRGGWSCAAGTVAGPAAPAAAAAKSSPLAGLVGDQTLDDFQAKKERDNAKRLATRKITNIAIPAVTLSFLAICTFFGEEKTKAFFSEFDNPMSNAPGFEQAKAAKAERKAQAKAEQEELIKALRVKVRGEAAVQSSD